MLFRSDDWAARGLLLPYKPIGWDQVPAAYKDPQARFTGLFMLTFANTYSKNLVSAENAPRDYADFHGNTVHYFEVPAPHQRLCVTAVSRIETTPLAARPAVAPAEARGRAAHLRLRLRRRGQVHGQHGTGQARDQHPSHQIGRAHV